MTSHAAPDSFAAAAPCPRLKPHMPSSPGCRRPTCTSGRPRMCGATERTGRDALARTGCTGRRLRMCGTGCRACRPRMSNMRLHTLRFYEALALGAEKEGFRRVTSHAAPKPPEIRLSARPCLSRALFHHPDAACRRFRARRPCSHESGCTEMPAKAKMHLCVLAGVAKRAGAASNRSTHQCG